MAKKKANTTNKQPKVDCSSAGISLPDRLKNSNVPPAGHIPEGTVQSGQSSDSQSETLGEEDTFSLCTCAESFTAKWSSFFKDNSLGQSLSHFEGQPEQVVLSDEDIDDVGKAWGFCLVGYFTGRFPGKSALLKLCDSWKVKYKFFSHQSGWLIFKFGSDEDTQRVLEGGPYSVFGRTLLLKKLPHCFEFDVSALKQVPVWVKLPGLPLECWNARALGKIVSQVGVLVTTDSLTASKERISFARVLVEVDVSVPLKRSVSLQFPNGKTRNQQVLFESEPKFCSTCSAFGHLVGNCGTINKPKGQDDKSKPKGGADIERPSANMPIVADRVSQPGWQNAGKSKATIVPDATGVGNQSARHRIGNNSNATASQT